MKFTARLMPAIQDGTRISEAAIAGLIGQRPKGTGGGLVTDAFIDDAGYVCVTVEQDEDGNPS